MFFLHYILKVWGIGPSDQVWGVWGIGPSDQVWGVWGIGPTITNHSSDLFLI